ncbi:MAG: hypothetical protein H7333_12480 [Bdellovibrionales bacterium]|nr:hypothetical protein [Oligoflexia bacterium]
MLNKITVLFLSLVLVNQVHANSINTLEFDSNVEAPLKQQMLDDLNFIASVKGSATTALHQQIFGKVEGDAYAKWFTARIFSIGKNSCGSANAVACVIPFQDPNKMWVTKNYTQFDHPQVARVSVIYHEARHSESEHGNWSHGKCPTPFLNAQGQNMTSIWTGALLQGQPACDITPFGSYGSQTILLKNLAMNCANCNAKVKADAELFASDQLGRVVNPAAKAQMLKDFGMR